MTAPTTLAPRHAPTGGPPDGARPWDRVRFSAETEPGAVEPETEPDLDQLPPVAPWAATLVRAAVEVLTGSRPTAQLTRWLSAELYDQLARRAGLAVRVLGRPDPALCARVRRVRCTQVRPGVHEAAVVVHDGVRIRAAAVRVECHRGRWRATALEIG
ncbi:energy transducer TonB [Georgenia sp. 311]|uniref:Rv3235 family protein n=1 Tax=Georgenia sp. 311 TaxID=2585134 RepID=UPI0011121AFB|nr:Rv3235 family protein [Georgenia sp. 311]TNC16806.1 energy transducer TonB [Georgenia sp. 311]